MSTDLTWMPTQVFLSSGSNPAIFEVEINTSTSDLRCTCPGFKTRRSCKHIQFVDEVITDNGHYTVEMVERVADDDLREAREDRAKMARIVRTHGRVLVI